MNIDDFSKIYTKLNEINVLYEQKHYDLYREYAFSGKDPEVSRLYTQINVLKARLEERYAELSLRAEEDVNDSLADELKIKEELRNNLNQIEEKFNLMSYEKKETLYNLYLSILNYDAYHSSGYKIIEINDPQESDDKDKKIVVVSTTEVCSEVEVLKQQNSCEKNDSFKNMFNDFPGAIMPLSEEEDKISYVKLMGFFSKNNSKYPDSCSLAGKFEGNSPLTVKLNQLNQEIITYKMNHDIYELTDDDVYLIVNNYKQEKPKVREIQFK